MPGANVQPTVRHRDAGCLCRCPDHLQDRPLAPAFVCRAHPAELLLPQAAASPCETLQPAEALGVQLSEARGAIGARACGQGPCGAASQEPRRGSHDGLRRSASLSGAGQVAETCPPLQKLAGTVNSSPATSTISCSTRKASAASADYPPLCGVGQEAGTIPLSLFVSKLPLMTLLSCCKAHSNGLFGLHAGAREESITS
jgi:hypothetical protein